MKVFIWEIDPEVVMAVADDLEQARVEVWKTSVATSRYTDVYKPSKVIDLPVAVVVEGMKVY